ncbi:unnamed protein product [Closterium sp. Yama58-4]|nr:unnamed protein product [Closterium sp. Yama58-4]
MLISPPLVYPGINMTMEAQAFSGSIPDFISSLTDLSIMAFQRNLLDGEIPESIGELFKLCYLSLASNQLYGTIPEGFTKLTRLTYLDLSRNYLTGPVSLPAISSLRLFSNYLSGPLPEGACQARSFDANCFTLPTDFAPSTSTSASAAAACGGRGVCIPGRAGSAPSCLCSAEFIKYQRINCVTEPKGASHTILPPATVLTKGTKKETTGVFTADPVTLFVYEAGQAVSGCGVQLAFQVNFTFSLSAQSGRGVGHNGFAFVISATDRVGSGSGVGYGGMDNRSMAIEFDTLTNKEHGDIKGQHVGLNIRGQDRSLAAVNLPFVLNNKKAYTAWVDYEPGEPGTIQVFLADTEVRPEQPLLERRLALCEVLQAGAEQTAYFFGFVASTTVKPLQMQVILKSAVHTGLPASRDPVNITPAFGLTLSVESYAPVGASPFMRYMSADYRVSPNQLDPWGVSGSHSWDSMPFLGWPVKNQKDCNASWAYAVVASVEAAYGIALNKQAPQLSVESLFAAMGLTSPAAKCTAGGSPAAAFKKLLTLPRGGLTTYGRRPTKYPIQGFERTRFKGYVGLMLAVQRQPVVVHIEASAASFIEYDGTSKYQDPDCYTGNLNHAVLIVGYLVSTTNARQSPNDMPFWIIRNSWGVDWGDWGHMRMDIQGGDGVCGINVLPGIYPIVKISKDPCGQKSFKRDGDLQPTMNFCGRFKCLVNTRTKSNTCNCTIPNEAKQPFVEVANGFGSNTCAYVNMCSSYSINPCAAGSCINDGKGGYSCICPPNYVESRTVENFPTCDPANTTTSALTVTGANWWCSDVFPAAGLALASVPVQSMGVNCSQPLPQGKVIQLESTPTTPCTAFYYVRTGDTCSSINDQIGLAATKLASLNPGLNCSEPIKAGRSLCIERNATFAFVVPRCSDYGMLTAQDTCEDQLLQAMESSEDESVGSLSGDTSVGSSAWIELYRNNPGLFCPRTIPATSTTVSSVSSVQVCLKAYYEPFNARSCKMGRIKAVSSSLTCAGAFSFFNGAQPGNVKKFYEYNEDTCSGTVHSNFICVP